MKRLLKFSSILLVVLSLMIVGSLYVTRSQPVMLRLTPDDNIRPRYYCLMNPFRDRTPEKVAEDYFGKLAAGQVASISCCTRQYDHISEREKEFPILSWRIGNRQDNTEESELMYWVKRGNGYPVGHEDQVHFRMVRSGNIWKLQSFSAIY
jgi:hypothetical protein